MYSAVTHYLKSVSALNSKTTADVVKFMKETPTDDVVLGKGKIREDGRRVQDMYLFQVKKPEESKGPWDYYKLLATIPAKEAFRPIEAGGCNLIK